MSVPGYSAWSVTAGEQPTTSYWNILGSNDAAFNTFLSNPNILSSLLALSSGYTGGVASYTNTGNGGGIGYYINLGGIKLCWGQTGSAVSESWTAPNFASSLTISLPSSFFTSVQYPLVSVTGGNGIFVSVVVDNISASSISFGINQSDGSSPAPYIGWFVIGT